MPVILGNLEAHWGVKGLFKADATQCAEEIKTLGEGFSPADVVNLAANKKTELHKCFTWDNDKAADKWRLQEARIVVQNLKITYIKDEGQEPVETKVRMFYRNDTEESKNYKTTQFIVSQADEHERLLERAKHELEIFRAKYRMLTELEDIFEIIDAL